MKVKAFWIFAYFLVCSMSLFAADSVVGFWKTMNEKTGKPESILAVYEYKGNYFGRIILTYKPDGTINDTIYAPVDRAPGVKGNPYYSGLDIIWDLAKEDSKYGNGAIMDPEKGKVYDAEMWLDKGNLIVRGEVLIFGRNQTWPPAKDSDFPPGFVKPDLTKLVPKIPEVNETEEPTKPESKS